ncbi:MAG: M23 family metallopeptidase [Desertimonas sp.]
MRRFLLAAAAGALMLAPSVPLLAVAVVMNPAADAECLNLTSIVVGEVPDSLTATTANGQTITLNRTQLTHARTITVVGSQTEGVGYDGIVIALMAALTESGLRMLANTGAYPDSADYPNDGNGSDHDSLGLFQMRPVSGWGTVAELMTPTYQARAFYGGPTGPNHGSPRGLLDIPNWQNLTFGQAAQAVEVSAHPDRYANYEPVARTILSALTVSGAGPGVSETGIVVMPLPAGSYVVSSPFGMRDDPLNSGTQRHHRGIDYATADGTPILAVADGLVLQAGDDSNGDNQIAVEHTVAGQTIVSVYRHMWDHGIHVTVGDRVIAGQHIADVGSQGPSTGPHLHFELRPGGPTGEPIDPQPWLATHTSDPLAMPTTGGPGCTSTVGLPGAPLPFTGSAGGTVPDPTGTGGFVTTAMAHLIAQTRPVFPDSAWSCWSPRPGSVSEHPLGRACDVTFGNRIGVFPTSEQVAEGWRMTNWLQAHAATLGVQYLVWQGHIWSAARDAEGWRPYQGNDSNDAASITGGHYDHLHITVTT